MRFVSFHTLLLAGCLLLPSQPVFCSLAECFNAESYNTNKMEPTKTEVTPCLAKNSLCYKETTDTKINGIIYKSSSFGCDSGGTLCLENGVDDNKCKKKKGGHFCCCDSNLCNDAPAFPLKMTTLSVILFLFYQLT